MNEGTETRKERNIMILFLSNFIFSYYSVKRLDANGEPVLDEKGEAKKENRKCLLPPGRYSMEALIKEKKEETWVECIQTNEAPIKDVLLILKGQPLDAVFCLVSDKVGGRTEGRGNLTVWESKDSDNFQTYTNEMEFFLKERLPSINEDPKIKAVIKRPLTADIFEEVAFHESANDPSAESIRAARELEIAITTYIKHENQKGNALSIEDCHIYADITGGKRTANMAISAALQLLQYSGANLERVIYSDYDRDRPAKDGEEKPIHPVSNVQPINDMYKLVAGVDAFTKYGSSAALDEYFADVISDGKNSYEPLKKLLIAMGHFSESVLLCQPDDIITNLKELIGALNVFPEKTPQGTTRPAKVELFARMLKNLNDIYKPMYPDLDYGKENRLAIIQWCVKNSLLQQAVTFCTEWLPEYFVEHGILFTEDAAIQTYCNEAMTSYRPGKKNFVMEFCATNREWKDIFKITVNLVLSDLYAGNLSANEAKEKMPDGYENFIDQICLFLSQLPNDLNQITHDKPTNNKRLEKMARRVKKDKKKVHYTKVTQQDILDRMGSWAFDPEYNFDYPNIEQYSYQTVNLVGKEEDADYKITNTANVTREMLQCGMMQTEFQDVERTVEFVKRYKEIQTKLRNKICHASEEEEILEDEEPITIDSVKEKLETLLQEIDNLESFKDPSKPKYTGRWKPKREYAKKEASA